MWVIVGYFFPNIPKISKDAVFALGAIEHTIVGVKRGLQIYCCKVYLRCKFPIGSGWEVDSCPEMLIFHGLTLSQ